MVDAASSQDKETRGAIALPSPSASDNKPPTWVGATRTSRMDVKIQCERERARRLEQRLRRNTAADGEFAREQRAHEVAQVVSRWLQLGRRARSSEASLVDLPTLALAKGLNRSDDMAHTESGSTRTPSTVDFSPAEHGFVPRRCALSERLFQASQRISVEGLQQLAANSEASDSMLIVVRVILLLISSLQDEILPLSTPLSTPELEGWSSAVQVLRRGGALVFAMQHFHSVAESVPLAAACKAGLLLATMQPEELADLRLRDGIEGALLEWAEAALALSSQSLEEALDSAFE